MTTSRFTFRTTFALLALLSALLAGPAEARYFYVNDTLDTVDAAIGNCVCADGAGKCTLRAAIQEANACAGADVVVLAARVYYLTIPGIAEEAAATGDLDIEDPLSVVGKGPTLTFVDGGTAGDRVFHVLSGTNATFTNLTIQNGVAATLGVSEAGGGLLWETTTPATVQLRSCNIVNNSAYPCGGGIQVNDTNNLATFVMSNCNVLNNRVSTTLTNRIIFGGGVTLNNIFKATIVGGAIRGNTVSAPSSTTVARGGGLSTYQNANMTIATTQITDNLVTATDAALGGGIDDAGGVTRLTSVIVSGNKATATGATGHAWGGGYFKQETEKATIYGCTFAGNAVEGFSTTGGGIYIDESSTACGTTITASAVRGNHNIGPSPIGGGVAVQSAPGLVIRSCVIASNHIEGEGGGSGGGLALLDAGGDEAYTILYTTVSGNQIRVASSARGGGLYHVGNALANLTITGSRVLDNLVLGGDSNGGGIWSGVPGSTWPVLNGGTVVVRNNLGGPAREGGGIYAPTCPLTATPGVAANIPDQVNCP
jgi:CSLREA domain-containing protein